MTDVSKTATGGARSSDVLPDGKRRKVLSAATAIAGGIGAAAAAVPFVVSMSPSERSRAAAAPVELSFAGLPPGGQVTVEWRGRPIWVLHRTEAMLRTLRDPHHRQRLADPDSKVTSQQPAYARNDLRSIKPEYLVLIPICTHLGCVPTFRPDVAPLDLGPDWAGGFFCPCHGSKFDLAGRVYRNVPAPTNLVIPPHRYVSETTVVVGVETEPA